MKDRLIDLLVDTAHEYHAPTFSETADYLINNGVIVPPCALGDTVYCLLFHRDTESYPKKTVAYSYLEETVVGVHICDSRLRKNAVTDKKYRDYLITQVGCHNAFRHIPMNKIGKTVFLSKEEAEQALNKAKV